MHEALISMREYLARARHAGAELTQDPDGQEILRLVMRAEEHVNGWLSNAGALIEPIEDAPDALHDIEGGFLATLKTSRALPANPIPS